MKLGIKSLFRTEMSRIKSKKINLMDINENFFEGKICLLTINDITEPLIVQYPTKKVKIADKSYKWMQFAPYNKNWWLTIMYDENNNIIESYYDITKKNIFNKDNPYYIDMKLDVVIPYNEEPYMVDDDELKQALEEKLINKNEYDMALEIAKKIMDDYSKNKEEYYKKVDYYFRLLNKNI